MDAATLAARTQACNQSVCVQDSLSSTKEPDTSRSRVQILFSGDPNTTLSNASICSFLGSLELIKSIFAMNS